MESLWRNIFRSDSEAAKTRALLKKTPIFAQLRRRELEAVERILYKRKYVADETIFSQGDPGISMYIIQQGTVLILHEPSKRILAELKAGDFFGEIALLNETPRSASAIAKTDCILLGVAQPDLLGLLERDTNLGYRVLLPLAKSAGQRVLSISEDMQALYEQMEQLTSGNGHSHSHESTGYTTMD